MNRKGNVKTEVMQIPDEYRNSKWRINLITCQMTPFETWFFLVIEYFRYTKRTVRTLPRSIMTAFNIFKITLWAFQGSINKLKK